MRGFLLEPRQAQRARLYAKANEVRCEHRGGIGQTSDIFDDQGGYMAIAQFGFGSQPTYLPPILQSLQIVAQQLQQLQQLNYVQQQQIQQLQQWIQVVPQQLQQLQQQVLGQQSQFGVQAPGLGGLLTQPFSVPGAFQGLSSASQPFPQQPSHVM
jgi:hypothetical protein